MTSYLCIIPARGGSKSIPGKNLRVVAGKPLLAWSIEQALASIADKVVVSTDSAEIAAVAKDAGAEVPFMRPAELATDTAATEPVLLHALDELERNSGYRPEAVVLLQPTCPIRKAGTVDRAIRHFAENRADSLVGAREIHPFLWEDIDNPKALYDFMNRPRRQDVPPEKRIFEETGAMYITRTGFLRRTGNRLGGKIAIFPMDAEESWDIDAESDLMVVDALLSRKVTE